MRRMRRGWVGLIPLLLGGCVPPAVAVASYAVDGASYATSGKSLSDHGLSAAADKDCATWHFFVGKAICRDPRHADPPAPLEYGAPGPLAANAVPRPQAKPAIPDAAGRYLVIGSFADRRNAARLARRFEPYHARVVTVMRDGRALARVVLGPLDRRAEAALRSRGVSGFATPASQLSAGISARQTRASG